MGERIDDFKETAKQTGTVVIDSTLGVVQGFMLAAWPVILLSAAAVITVALVRLPRQILGGRQNG